MNIPIYSLYAERELIHYFFIATQVYFGIAQEQWTLIFNIIY